MRTKRFWRGLALVVVSLVVIAIIVMVTRGNGSPNADQPTTLNCIGGSEKVDLMNDAQVKQILHDKGLTVNYASRGSGSYGQVQLKTDELKQYDCIWPASASAQGVFENEHKGDFPDYRAESVLLSPEVIFAGPHSTDALVNAGIVQQRDGKYFVINMKDLLTRVLHHQAWDGPELKATGLVGPVAIASTDPTKSNSGFTLYQLILDIIATDSVQAPSMDQARTKLPIVRQLLDAQGLLARGSAEGFSLWQLKGGESSAPLFAGYENLFIEEMLKLDPNQQRELLSRVRILYPDPTIYSEHPILGLSANAGRFIEAMKDPEIQKIAFQKYGFRPGVAVAGIGDVSYFKNLPLAQDIHTTAPPNVDVSLALLKCVNDTSGSACQ